MKLILADMDGTLLNDQKELPHDIEEVIDALKEKGIKFGIASGRQASIIKPYFKELFNDMYVISNNGANIDRGDEVIAYNPISKDLIRDVEAEIRKHEGLYVLYTGLEHAYHSIKDPEALAHVQYYTANTVIYESIDEFIDKEAIVKIAVYDSNFNAKENYKDFLKFNTRASVVVSNVEWFDIMPLNTSKGDALKKLMDLLGYGPKDVMVFGDFDNDISMLESVYYSYAMGNAAKHVKEVCNFECEDNNHEGVTKEIRRFFNI